jgi:menaquinone-9 beta-reductase
LCEQLIARPELRRNGAGHANALKAARAGYARAWRTNFSPRLLVAAVFARVFTRPIATRIATTLLERFPQLLSEGARWSGKSQPLRGMSTSGQAPS